MTEHIISSLHFERAFLSSTFFLPAVFEDEESDEQNQHRSSCSSDDSFWSRRPESLTSLTSDECDSDVNDCRNNDEATYFVQKVAQGDPLPETELPRYSTTSVCQINNISKQEILQNIHKHKPRHRTIPINNATIAALSGQRRSITSSPWTCLEDSHHPLCQGDCDIGTAVFESGNDNNVLNAHTATSIRPSLYSSSSSAPVGTDDHLSQKQKHDSTWLDSPPVLIRRRIATSPATISEQSTSTTRTHRRNKDVLCAPRTSAFWTALQAQSSSNCLLPSQPMQHRRRDSSRRWKLLDRHPRAIASSLCFENAEEFEVYLQLRRS